MSNLEQVTLEGGEVILAHKKGNCNIPELCAVHNPSDHNMRDFKQHWRYDRGIIERICPHGVGHPDPDIIAYIRAIAGDKQAECESVHGCDGCCVLAKGRTVDL